MNVNSIIIRLTGKYNITKLASLGFHKINSGWLFDGKLHRYIFTPRNESVVITITPRPPDWRTEPTSGTPHEITFRNFPDWLMKYVDTIQE